MSTTGGGEPVLVARSLAIVALVDVRHGSSIRWNSYKNMSKRPAAKHLALFQTWTTSLLGEASRLDEHHFKRSSVRGRVSLAAVELLQVRKRIRCIAFTLTGCWGLSSPAITCNHLISCVYCMCRSRILNVQRCRKDVRCYNGKLYYFTVRDVIAILWIS